MTTDIHKARTQFSKLLKCASQGADVIISQAGVPVAVLVAIDRLQPKRELGFAVDAFTMSSLEDFNAPLDLETLALCNGKPHCDGSPPLAGANSGMSRF